MAKIIKFTDIYFVKTLKNGNSLYEQGDFYGAINEYKKLMYEKKYSKIAFDKITHTLTILNNIEWFEKSFTAFDKENILEYITLSTFEKEKFLDKLENETPLQSISKKIDEVKNNDKKIDEFNLSLPFMSALEITSNTNLINKFLKSTSKLLTKEAITKIEEILSNDKIDPILKQKFFSILKQHKYKKEIRYVNKTNEQFFLKTNTLLINENPYVLKITDEVNNLITNNYIVEDSIIDYIVLSYFASKFPIIPMQLNLDKAILYKKILRTLALACDLKKLKIKFNLTNEEYDLLTNNTN